MAESSGDRGLPAQRPWWLAAVSIILWVGALVNAGYAVSSYFAVPGSRGGGAQVLGGPLASVVMAVYLAASGYGLWRRQRWGAVMFGLFVLIGFGWKILQTVGVAGGILAAGELGYLLIIFALMALVAVMLFEATGTR